MNGNPAEEVKVPICVTQEQKDACPFVKETYSDMEGERYRCSKCGYSYYLDYEDMR